MKVGALGPRAIGRRLAGPGLAFGLGPYTACLRTALPDLAAAFAVLYAHHDLRDPTGFVDFEVSLEAAGGLRRWWRPQVRFRFDGAEPFKPLPRDQATAMFEWGLNWCVAAHAHDLLIVHAAVLAHGEDCLVMPGPPGAGKSTLCAGLALRGWRLLSDEMALIDPETLALLPIPRPVGLKNASIEVIRAFEPDAVIGPVAHDTAKGTVAHLAPPAASVEAALERGRATWLVLPRWEAGADARFEPLPRDLAFLEVAEQSFNYDIHGERGFQRLNDLLAGLDCRTFRYGRLEEAVVAFERLAAGVEEAP